MAFVYGCVRIRHRRIRNAVQAKETPSPAVQGMQYGGVRYERKYVNGKYYVVFIYGDDMEVVKE